MSDQQWPAKKKKRVLGRAPPLSSLVASLGESHSRSQSVPRVEGGPQPTVASSKYNWVSREAVTHRFVLQLANRPSNPSNSLNELNAGRQGHNVLLQHGRAHVKPGSFVLYRWGFAEYPALEAPSTCMGSLDYATGNAFESFVAWMLWDGFHSARKMNVYKQGDVPPSTAILTHGANKWIHLNARSPVFNELARAYGAPPECASTLCRPSPSLTATSSTTPAHFCHPLRGNVYRPTPTPLVDTKKSEIERFGHFIVKRDEASYTSDAEVDNHGTASGRLDVYEEDY